MAGKCIEYLYAISIIFLALGFAFIHMYHVSTLFENDRHFSHLSNLEREMTFRTEMGFYYHYYKTIVNAVSFEEGLNELFEDNKTEYPKTINAVRRFNLYPEIVIGGLYRIFDSVTKKLNIPTKQCWEVSRGPTLPPVNSCEGLGDPVYFYLEFVWYCAGLSKAVLFLYAVLLSESLSGGLLTVLSFLYNHGHCTRVQWTPPLRESFAYPFCLLQMLTVTHCLKKFVIGKTLTNIQSTYQIWAISTCTMLSLVLWQFSQFMIATQIVILLLMFFCGLIERNNVLLIIFSQAAGFTQASLMLFGNELLIQSILFSLLTATLFVVLNCEHKFPDFSLRGLLTFGAVGCVGVTLKLKINHYYGNHDAHIFEILRSKLTSFKSFHTLLYTCSPEFDLLPFSTIKDLIKTGLLPIAVIILIFIIYKWGLTIYECRKENIDLITVIEPHILYNTLQLGVFTVMALYIMRLKLFWTPHLCIMISLIMSSKYSPIKKNSKYAVLALLIATMSFEGINNVVRQRNIIGEYANLPFEEVLNWINSETTASDVFAGPMSIMANVLLSTGRNIVNHPHYEHPSVRERTMKVYSIFSRQPSEEVYSRLVDMGVDYVILEESWCFPRSRENCSMVAIWDTIDAENRNREALCPKLFSGNPSPFIRAFSNEVFVILSLKARQFIEFTPLQRYQI